MRASAAALALLLVPALAACDSATSNRAPVAPTPAVSCETAPSGTVDPLPFKAGDVVRFSLRTQKRESSFGSSSTTRSGTLAWTVEGVTCTSAGRNVTLMETEVATDTLRTFNPNTGQVVEQTVVPISRSERFTVTLSNTGALPKVGAYAFGRLGDADVPPRFFPGGAYTYDHYPGFHTTGRTTASAGALGLTSFVQSVDGMSPTFSSSVSLTRRP